VVRKLLVLIAVAIPLTLAACGSSDSSSSTTAATDTGGATSSTESSTTASGGSGGGETVDISETEFKLDPADATAKAGSVTLNASNDGTITHDLEIEGNGVEESTDALDPGASGQVTVDLKPGTYEIYCNIADHRAQGMEGTLTVQ
jgi:uncharacterized cupredoxin-like copper-binding protein